MVDVTRLPVPVAAIVQPVDLSNQRLAHLDAKVDAAEGDGIVARWEFGRALLAEVVGKQLPAGRLDEVAAAIGKARSEVSQRLRLARQYETEDELRYAVAKFGSWHGFVTNTTSESRMDVHYSSATDEWATPQDLFDHLHAEFGFDLDVCATDANAKCPTYYTEREDGLSQPWTGVCWMNPPYGDGIAAWVRKAYESSKDGATVVCLVPARVDTGWWWDYCRHGQVRFLRGRLKFGGGENAAPFPSAVVVFPASPDTIYWERAA